MLFRLKLQWKQYFASIVIFVYLFLTSCDQNKTQSVTYKNTSINIEANLADKASLLSRVSASKNFTTLKLDQKDSIFKFHRFYDKIDFIPLELTKQSIIGEVDKVLFNGAQLFVFDRRISKGLFAFDLHGKFIYSIRGNSKANGAVFAPSDFCVFNKSLLILDESHIIKSYDLQTGRFLTQVKLPFRASSINISDPDAGLVELYSYTKKDGLGFDYKVIQVNINTQEITSKDFPKSDLNFNYGSVFNLFKGSDGLLLSQNLNDTIYKIEKKKIVPFLFLNFSGQNLPKDFFSKNSGSTGHQVLADLNKTSYAHAVGHLMSTPVFTYFTYTSKHMMFSVFWNKSKGLVTECKSFSDNLFLGSVQSTPVGTVQSKFIYALDPHILKIRLENLKSTMKRGTEKVYEKYLHYAYDIDRSVSKNSNPVIVLANPRS